VYTPSRPEGSSLTRAVVPATGGTITSEGVYTESGTPGQYTVIATWTAKDLAKNGTFNNSASVEILPLPQNQLKITDYRYTDVNQKGNQPKKGVIAQDVEKVYPSAVRTMTGFIPSVYAMADSARYNEATHELTVTVPKAHGFAAADMVRIITADGREMDKPVEVVTDDYSFVLVDVEKAYSQVFVFGKQVDDFRVVDYDQLFSMNIGATQQLAIENQKLVEENAAINAEEKVIETRLAALEQVIEELRKQK